MKHSYGNKITPSLLALFIACSVPTLVFADDTADDKKDNSKKETVVVTGARKLKTTDTAKDAVAYGTSVQVVTAKQIEDSGAINFAEVAQFLVKGVNVGYSPDEGEFTIRLDGGGDRDTLVTIDGVPTYDRGTPLETIWGATTIDQHMVDHIEVFRGGNSLFFGSNGGIGVVNVITKKPDGSKKGEFGVSAGSFNSREIWGNYSIPLDKEGNHSVMFYGSMLATDGPRIFNPSLFTDNVALLGAIQRYPLNKNDVGVKYLWKIDDNTNFRANMMYTESWFQDPFPSGESYSPNTVRYPIMDVAFDKKFNDKFSIEASAYRSNPVIWNAELYPEVCKIAAGCINPNEPAKTIPYGAWTGAVEPATGHGFGTTNQYRAGYEEVGSTVRATFNLVKWLEFVVGAQYVSFANDSDPRYSTPNTDSQTTGVFIDLRPQFSFSPETKLSLAIRTDFADSFDQKTIWKFGFKQPFLTNGYIRANGGTSFSLPITTELYINNPRPVGATGAFTVIGNPDLLPEETKTFNGGIGWAQDFGDTSIRGEIGGFKTKITNRISSTSGLTLNTYYNNSAEIEILGATADFDIDFAKNWHVGLSYTSQDASDTAGSRKGIQINETPAWMGSVTLDWKSDDNHWHLQLLGRIQGDEFATGGPAIPGTTKPAVGGKGADTGVPRYRTNFGNYKVFNATINYNFGEDLENKIQFRVVNLFDEYYAERWGYGNNFYAAAFNRGEYTNQDDRYYYGYPFEGKPRSYSITYSTKF